MALIEVASMIACGTTPSSYLMMSFQKRQKHLQPGELRTASRLRSRQGGNFIVSVGAMASHSARVDSNEVVAKDSLSEKQQGCIK